MDTVQQVNAFTVDLEDWFQGLTSTNPQVERWPEFESRVEANTRRLLALLREFNVAATFFVLGYTADTHPALIEAIATEGHEIGVHGYYHRFVYKMSADEFAREIDRSLEAINRAVGIKAIGHRAPYFSLNRETSWAFPVLESRGFLYDSSVFPTKNTLYGYPGAPRFPYKVDGCDIVEFPATTAALAGFRWPVAGGFYNRLQPYSLIRHGIRQVNAQGQPAIIYVHPWEFDTGQNYSQVTVRERITHYHGRGGLRKKIEQLLSDFPFGPLQELLNHRNVASAHKSDARLSDR